MVNSLGAEKLMSNQKYPLSFLIPLKYINYETREEALYCLSVYWTITNFYIVSDQTFEAENLNHF
jgi:hypothetical protein